MSITVSRPPTVSRRPSYGVRKPISCKDSDCGGSAWLTDNCALRLELDFVSAALHWLLIHLGRLPALASALASLRLAAQLAAAIDRRLTRARPNQRQTESTVSQPGPSRLSIVRGSTDDPAASNDGASIWLTSRTAALLPSGVCLSTGAPMRAACRHLSCRQRACNEG